MAPHSNATRRQGRSELDRAASEENETPKLVYYVRIVNQATSSLHTKARELESHNSDFILPLSVEANRGENESGQIFPSSPPPSRGWGRERERGATSRGSERGGGGGRPSKFGKRLFDAPVAQGLVLRTTRERQGATPLLYSHTTKREIELGS